jgi:hypothetical protein
VAVTGTTSFTYTRIGAGSEHLDGDGIGRFGDLQLCGHGQHDLHGQFHSADGGRDSYSVTATVAADSNYNGASSSATAFTIGKATPSGGGDGGQLHLQRDGAGTECGDVQPGG